MAVHAIDPSTTNALAATNLDKDALFAGLFRQLPKSSQVADETRLRELIEKLRAHGVCRLEGADEEIRPLAVGLQCLFEEAFVAMHSDFDGADFEIHTTMPSTPCCKLPDEKTKETYLARFDDAARLATVDGRSKSLDAISALPQATVHLTYTQQGLERRAKQERAVLEGYWSPKLHITCIESSGSLPVEVSGATYRLKTRSGTEIIFGIQMSQAADVDSKICTLHLGTGDQPEVKGWLDDLTRQLQDLGRTLFER